MEEKEIWKDIKDYEGLYQVSSLGKVKRTDKNKLLKENLSGCRKYLKVNLSKHGKASLKRVHQLVAIAFLNHEPCGMKLVVNHINNNKLDNRLENIEIVTSRENSNLKHIKSSSKYVGVSWCKRNGKWHSSITFKKKQKYLGYFVNEYDAHLAYQNALKKHLDGN